jgi:hypothetical protein
MSWKLHSWYVRGTSRQRASPFCQKPIMLLEQNTFEVRTVALPAVVPKEHVLSINLAGLLPETGRIR